MHANDNRHEVLYVDMGIWLFLQPANVLWMFLTIWKNKQRSTQMTKQKIDCYLHAIKQ